MDNPYQKLLQIASSLLQKRYMSMSNSSFLLYLQKNFNVLHIYLLLIRGRNIIKLCQMNIVNISISLLQKTQKLKIFEILFVHFRPSREVIFESKIGKSVTRLQSDQIWWISTT